jgi:hypothetical protein
MTRFVMAVSMGALGAAMLASPTMADQRGDGDGNADADGLQAKAKIVVNGDVKGGGGSVTASAPAICWWEKADVSTDNVDALATLFLILGLPFDKAAIEQVKDAEKDGEKFQWYTRKKREGATEEQLKAAGCNDPSGPFNGLFIGRFLRPFEPGNPPDPLPDPEEMADVALENIDLQAPALMWNPKVNSLGGGTLVNLPTWFWVTNPGPAVGNDNGERSVTATAAAGGQQVSVTVTAKASKLQIASPGGAATCSVDQARTAYAKGTPENSACTLAFKRSSNRYESGFPVQATVAWTASWTGTGPGVPAGEQQLDGVVMSSMTNVPVRESQAIVKGSS